MYHFSDTKTLNATIEMKISNYRRQEMYPRTKRILVEIETKII
jgi:hypothetical protein